MKNFVHQVNRIADHIEGMKGEIEDAIQSPDIEPDKVPSDVWDALCDLQRELDDFLICAEQFKETELQDRGL